MTVHRAAAALVICAALLASGVVAAPGASAGAPTICAPAHLSRAERLSWANTYRNGYYEGADMTGSETISYGRTVWLMGDTFIGGGHLATNTVIVEHLNGCFEFIMGWNPHRWGWDGILASNATHFYWPRDAIWENDRLHIVFTRYRRDPHSFLGGTPDAMIRAQVNTSTWTVERTATVPGGTRFGYGSSFVTTGGWTYVYGQGFHHPTNQPPLTVARYPAGRIDAAWQFWNGTGWSADPNTSAPILSGVPNGVGVNIVANKVVAVAQEGIFRDITLGQHEADAPWGPFTRTRTLMTVPNHNVAGHPATDGFSYIGAINAAGNDLMVGWSYNTFNTPLDGIGDPRYYGTRWSQQPTGLGGTYTPPPTGPGDTSVPAPGRRFVDVIPGAFYDTAIGWLVANNITTGVAGTNRFAPDQGVTRGELSTFLWRHAGRPHAPAPRFDDVDPRAFYATPIAWVHNTGIRGPIPATNGFGPDAAVTRAEMAMFLWRYAGSPAAGTSRFVDVGPASAEATAIAWLDATRITTGVGGTNRFAPDRGVTRGEMATFIHRFHHR